MMLMRLQRALARAGVTSRRKAEDLIRAGRVRVDGAVATIGMSADPLRQRVTVDGRAGRGAGPEGRMRAPRFLRAGAARQAGPGQLPAACPERSRGHRATE